VWLREAILGEHVKDPPADVPPLEETAGADVENAVTIKELLRLHRKEQSCNVCHASLDPWGIPFEKYNAVGKYQPMAPKAGVKIQEFDAARHKDLAGYEAYLKTVNTVPIEANARLPLGPEVDGMEQLKAFLLKERKDDIAENVVRRFLTYSLGRSLTYKDLPVVEKICSQTTKNDYRFQDILIAICQSDAFRGQANK
jgi:hypothetical protein